MHPLLPGIRFLLWSQEEQGQNQVSSLVAKRGCLGCAWGQVPDALFLRGVCTSSLHSYWSIFGTPPFLEISSSSPLSLKVSPQQLRHIRSLEGTLSPAHKMPQVAGVKTLL